MKQKLLAHVFQLVKEKTVGKNFIKYFKVFNKIIKFSLKKPLMRFFYEFNNFIFRK